MTRMKRKIRMRRINTEWKVEVKKKYKKDVNIMVQGEKGEKNEDWGGCERWESWVHYEGGEG